MLSWIRMVFNTGRNARAHTRTRGTATLGAELLEARDNPSTIELIGSTLQVTGTSAMDRVSISIPASGPSAGKLVVEDWIGLGYAYVGISEFDPAAVQAVTFYGYGGDDRLTMNVGGWALEVYAFCGEGNDTITAGNGDDYLFGEAGHDRLYAGYGYDYLSGGAGDDELRGDGGRDSIWGGDGNDSLFGGYPSFLLYTSYVIDEDDELHGGNGNDVINGELGSDLIYGDAGDDILIGGDIFFGSEVDRVYGGEGHDVLYGSAATDYLYGGNGNDLLYGLAGNDFLYGEGGFDRLYGNEGNDRLDGGEGIADQLTGGTGADTFVRYWSEFRFERDAFLDYNTAEGDSTYSVSPLLYF
jgi:Ca2+-binding RTX toxin-like protein